MSLLNTAKIIAAIESTNNQYAVRFEPKWRYFSDNVTMACKLTHQCSDATARNILASSWGAYQIMGQVLYEIGYPLNIYREYLQSKETQLETFLNYIEHRNICYTPEHLIEKKYREEFARKYNGNVEHYSARLVTELQALGYHVEL